MELGKPMKEQFLLDKSVTHINHGSYGATPKCVMEQRLKYIYEQESQPDFWFRSRHPKYYEESLAAAAEFLGAKTENLALVDNVTTGINTIIKSLSFKPGDKILVNSHTYGAIANIIREQEDFKGIEIVTVPITLPIKSEDEFVEMFRKEYEKHKPIKLHVFDHIASCSSLLFPVKKLVKLAKEYGTMSLVDGAHAPGQVEVNVTDIDADFYSGNFHKWCFVPRSCGFLWFSPKYDGMIRPLVTSHGYKHSLNDQFGYCGTRDYSNIFCIPSALKFLKDIGGVKAIQAHTEKLLTPASKSLAAALGTEELDVPASMKAPCIRLIRLPIEKPAQYVLRYGPDINFRDATTEMIACSRRDHDVETFFGISNGSVWLRLSASIYSTQEDFEKIQEGLVRDKSSFNC